MTESTVAPISELEQYRRHRELLLKHIDRFTESLKTIEMRVLSQLSMGYKTGVFADGLGGRTVVMDPELLIRRQRELIEHITSSDRDAIALQRSWRVLLVPIHTPDLAISFCDDFFLDPLASLDSRHIRLRSIYPDRFVIVDREAGRNPVETALKKALKNRPRGAVSRLPTKPPFLLQASIRRDFVREDVEIVRTCANGNKPDDFDQVVVNKLYKDVARSAGWKRGRRLPNYAPKEAATEWMRLVRAVRKRWHKLERVLGPFPET